MDQMTLPVITGFGPSGTQRPKNLDAPIIEGRACQLE
jgi:hypothetical protein